MYANKEDYNLYVMSIAVFSSYRPVKFFFNSIDCCKLLKLPVVSFISAKVFFFKFIMQIFCKVPFSISLKK